MIKKQRILIIVLCVVFLAMLAVYMFVLRPMTSEPAETEAPGIDTSDGEVKSAGNTVLMFPQIERKDIQSIEVHNSYGSYSFSYHADLDDFLLDGYENLAFDAAKFSSLVVGSGYTLVISKVTQDATDEELASYGLRDEDEPAWYKLTTRSGSSHTVKIGKKIISGGGYYAMCDDRTGVYIIGADIETTLLAPIEDMVSPMLTAGAGISTYFYIDNFTIYKHGEKFISFRAIPKEEMDDEVLDNALILCEYPAEYERSNNYDVTLQTLAAYEGDSVAALGLTEENLEKFGLADEPYVIEYDYQGFKFRLVASEPVDGFYYVSTSMFNDIVKVPEADFEFLQWDLMYWVATRFFQRNITFVNNIKIESADVNETFRLYHHPDDDPNLVVIGDGCGEIDDVANFRNFYKTLLLCDFKDYAPEDVEVDDDDLMLRYTVTTNGGKVTEYAFYRYSTRRCLLTVNGSGQFYVLTDSVEKIISDAAKVRVGAPVVAEDKS